MTENQKHFEDLILSTEGAELGNLFGKPCGKINKKAFVAFYQDEMVFKLGKEQVDLLIEKYKNAQNWDPSGKIRPMKDWIQIPKVYQKEWHVLCEEAVKYYHNT